MTARYDPKHEAPPPIAEGDYDVEIIKVDETDNFGAPLMSKKGDDMEVVTFAVHGAERKCQIKVYFTFGPKNTWRYSKLSKALGKHADFKAKTFRAADYIGSVIRGHVGIQVSDEYGERNTLDVIVGPEEAQQTKATYKQPVVAEKITDADIPF